MIYVGVGIVVLWVKLPMALYPMRVPFCVLAAPLYMLLVSRTGQLECLGPCTHKGELGEAPGFGLAQSRPNPGCWGYLNEPVDGNLSLSLSSILSLKYTFQINTPLKNT